MAQGPGPGGCPAWPTSLLVGASPDSRPSWKQNSNSGPKYKPPVSDINAPDLYIPVMSFFTYCLVCCLADILSEPSRFKPEVRHGMGWMMRTGAMN